MNRRATTTLTPGELAELEVAAIAAPRYPPAITEAMSPPPEWPPAPCAPGPPPPEPLPIDVLPPVLRAHVASVAATTQTPPDMACMIALAAISATIRGRACVIVRDGWPPELVTIYTAVVLPPGTRKSPVYLHMVRPIEEWEAEERERVGPAYQRARDAAEVAGARLAEAKKVAARGKGSREEVEAARIELHAAEAAVPILPRVIASDATPEALVRLMASQGGSLALLAPEADAIGIADGRYSDSARVDELLRGWTGERIVSDRAGRDPIDIPHPALTVGICMQPSVLEDLRHARALRGRGLMGRILWCMPDHGLGRRLTGPAVPPLDSAAAERYGRLLWTLLGTDLVGFVGGARNLVLTPEALEVLHDYEAELEPQLADEGRLAGIRDAAAKMHGQAVRLSALLELAARAEDGRPLWTAPIGAWAMSGAVALVRALTTHALAVLGMAGQDPELEDLRYVLRRAYELPTGATLRDLHRACEDRRGMATMDDLMPVVENLRERHCIRLIEQRTGTPGRPPSPLVEVHPALKRRTPGPPRHNRQYSAVGSETGNSVGSVGAFVAAPVELEDLLTEDA
jgi:replicative DNA helicase